MSFNPDPSKSAVEVHFSRKYTPVQAPPLMFNGTVVEKLDSQKHLGLILDSRLSFAPHLEEKMSKANQGIGLINRLRAFLPRHSLLNIYKVFVRPHLDYGDIIYDNPGNNSLLQRLESIQYNAALAITGCFRGTSREKLYSELGLETLSDRRFCRKLCFFYKIVNGYTPFYLRKILPDNVVNSYALRSRPAVRSISARTESFQNTFFPFCLSQWNKLDCHIRDMPTIASFKRSLFNFFRPIAPPTFRVNDSRGVILLTRLRVGFSHLKEHKFRHNFLDTVDPFCSCRTNSIENTEHYLLHCPKYSVQRTILFNDLHNACLTVLPLACGNLCYVLLYGKQDFSNADNLEIYHAVVKYIIATGRFDASIFC